VRLRDDLVRLKIGVHSLHDSIDLDTAAGRLTWNILASASEYESEVRKERQMAGIATAKAKGVYKGRKRGTFKIKNPERVLALRAKGLSVTEIAKSLGVGRNTVFVCLRGMKSTDSSRGEAPPKPTADSVKEGESVKPTADSVKPTDKTV
jgi:DNA invertase Pin-like site-specific DNA recombinase